MSILFLTTFLVIFGFTIADSDCERPAYILEKLNTNSKCQGCPPKYNDKLCASTTHYGANLPDIDPDHISPCNCPSLKFIPYHSVAVNQKMFNPLNLPPGQCASNCGLCFKLCPTGGCPQSNCHPPKTGECIDVMVKDRCPGAGGEGWCGQEMTPWECEENPNECKTEIRNTNKYGYPAHFDLHDHYGRITDEINGLGWHNIEVTFKVIDCPSSHKEPWMEYCNCTDFKKVTWSEEYLRKNKDKPDL
eukprot:11909.XXX_219504_220244_1 [CDS] Oithona nana genome sequencing.